MKSIQSKENITMMPETDLLVNILIEPEDFYGHLIHVALLTVRFKGSLVLESYLIFIKRIHLHGFIWQWLETIF